MPTITDKLDQLAEFQSQRDLLEMRKRELLDEVKVPAEVLAAQDDANKRRQKLNSEALAIQREIQAVTAQLMGEVEEPQMPAEYQEALMAARAQREEIQSQATARYEALAKKQAEQMAKLDAELQAQIRDVYAQMEQRKQEINVEFEGKAEAVDSNIAALTAEIKADVIRAGKTEKGAYFQAVYTKGRVTWVTDMLDGIYFTLGKIMEMLETAVVEQREIPNVYGELNGIAKSLAKARKEGQPSVSIRRI